MAYFIPSSIQKRLVRYALSRLELLETAGLDFDKLEIGWGKMSTIELKDVALRTDTLSTLLSLPKWLKMEYATVEVLRLTIPADLYTSSIVVEAIGVDARTNLVEEQHKTRAGLPRASYSKDIRSTRRHQNGRRRRSIPTSPSPKDDSKPVESSEEDENVVPTPHALAHSFLAEEPAEERAKLDAALNYHAEDLGKSVASIGNSDEDVNSGEGIGISLPGFIANFLKGIGDRLQLILRNVAVNLESELGPLPDESTGDHIPTSSAPTTISVNIGEVILSEVSSGTGNVSDAASPLFKGDEAKEAEYEFRVGKRCLTLKQIRSSLILEAAVLAQLSRISHRDVMTELQRSLAASSPTAKVAAGIPRPMTGFSPSLHDSNDDATLHTPTNIDSTRISQPLDMSFASNDGGTFADADDDQEADRNSVKSDGYGSILHRYGLEGLVGDASTSGWKNNGALSKPIIDFLAKLPSLASERRQEVEISESVTGLFQHLHDASKSVQDKRGTSTLQIGPKGVDLPTDAAEHRRHQSEPHFESPRASRPSRLRLELNNDGLQTPTGAVSDPFLCGFSQRSSPSCTPTGDADLSQSKMFSHEEAQNIYMSAMYEVPEQASRKLHMPGAWGESTTLDAYADDPILTSPLAAETSLSDINKETSLHKSRTGAEPMGYNNDFHPTTPKEARAGESQHVATSRSSRSRGPSLKSSEVIKEFLHIDQVKVWLPAAEFAGKVSTASNLSGKLAPTAGLSSRPDNRSAYQPIPGAFSVYAETRVPEKHNRSMTQSNSPRPLNQINSTVAISSIIHDPGGLLEVLFGIVDIQADVSMSRALAQLCKTLQLVLASQSAHHQDPQHPSPASESTHKNLKLCLQQVNLLFLEYLEPQNPHKRSNVSILPSYCAAPPVDGVIFVTKATNVDVTVKDIQKMSSTNLEIGNLSLGFPDEDILSFSRNGKIETSVRNLQHPHDKDVSVSITRLKGGLEINVSTVPLKIVIDLQRMDETLGSLGGFSGLLELGSSMTSDMTATTETPKAPLRSRFVHFEPSAKASSVSRPVSRPRFNARLGGASVTLMGKHCQVMYQSSAIKVVGREAVVGVQIDYMTLSGPRSTEISNPAIKIHLHNTSFKFLFVPEEHDLTRLISLLTPSKDKFEEDDDILLHTLVSQRKKGSVLRTTIGKAEMEVDDFGAFKPMQELAQEMASQPSVTKYLPQDSRPGMMTFIFVDEVHTRARTNSKIGLVSGRLKTVEVAHVGLPSLIASSIGKLTIQGGDNERLVTEVIPQNSAGQPPMIMVRMIGDDLEPVVKVKMWNTCFEYSVRLVMTFLNVADSTGTEDTSADLRASIILPSCYHDRSKPGVQSFHSSGHSSSASKSLRLDVALRDCAIGLTPRELHSKGIFVLTDSRFGGALPTTEGLTMKVELRKAALLVVDDVGKLINVDSSASVRRGESRISSHLVSDLCRQGFVSVSTISAAAAVVSLTPGLGESQDTVDVEFRDELFVLETCADSTQTLLELLNALQPPLPPSKGLKYRTEITAVQEMMASFTGEAFAVDLREPDGLTDVMEDDEGDEEGDFMEEELATDFDHLGDFSDDTTDTQSIVSALSIPEVEQHSVINMIAAQGIQVDKLSNRSQIPLESMTGELQPGELPPQKQGMANKWDSINNKYVSVSKSELRKSPLRLRMREMHIIWNLYDGYDWEKTRATITKAVIDVEARAEERRLGRRTAIDDEDDKESVIGDFLFNSIYIGVPVSHDPRELSRQINHNIDDLISETGSHASTDISRPSSSQRTPRNQGRRLRLERSKRHKIAFELRGVSADVFNFPSGEETQSSVDVRIKDLEIFDHVPTSTWKKFATYMHDAGPREDKKPMVHLEICNVRPVPELTASELVVRVTILPLRLHVDQDALDFITRFFDFNDDTQKTSSVPVEQPYLQRVEVRAVPIKLDYKPKKVDYAGLRSGRTTEFMNFFNLDGADMILKHAIVYGTSGFLKLHKSLEDVWMPDIRKNQLPSVLSGLNGVRTLVNVGSGVRDLVVIPIREYQKDGRIVRSISKGALSFARITGGELTRFGAKLAVGAQTALQGAEDFLGKPSAYNKAGNAAGGWEHADLDADERRAISHYADQPAGILQGLKGAARSLERDLLVTKDIIIAISGEVRESGSAEGAARAVVRNAPTLILRPMIGATKAIGQTLMGATNTVDPGNRRRVEDKYKRY